MKVLNAHSNKNMSILFDTGITNSYLYFANVFHKVNWIHIYDN